MKVEPVLDYLISRREDENNTQKTSSKMNQPGIEKKTRNSSRLWMDARLELATIAPLSTDWRVSVRSTERRALFTAIVCRRLTNATRSGKLELEKESNTNLLVKKPWISAWDREEKLTRSIDWMSCSWSGLPFALLVKSPGSDQTKEENATLHWELRRGHGENETA